MGKVQCPKPREGAPATSAQYAQIAALRSKASMGKVFGRTLRERFKARSMSQAEADEWIFVLTRMVEGKQEWQRQQQKRREWRAGPRVSLDEGRARRAMERNKRLIENS